MLRVEIANIGGVLAALVLLTPLTVQAATLATRGPSVAVTTDDFYAYQYMNSPKKVEALRSSERELQSTIVEVLAPRTFKAHPEISVKLDELEKRYYDIQLERAPLTAELNILERRARATFDAENPLTSARAKEIWATDNNRFMTEETADITQITFDFGKRSYAENIARIAEVQQKLNAGKSFDAVLLEYTDEKNVGETSGKISGVSALRTDQLMGQLIFKRLNEGEISAPTPGRSGFYIVRLDKKHPNRKQTYDEVKGKIFELMLEDAAKQARVNLLERLEKFEMTINEKAFDDFLIKPDPQLDEKRREIYKSLGIKISEPVDAETAKALK